MFGEFLWTIPGLSYIAGRGLKEQAGIAAQSSHTNNISKLREEYMAQWTDPVLEDKLEKDILMRSKYDSIWTRIEKYKENDGELFLVEPEFWEVVGLKRLNIFDKKGRLFKDGTVGHRNRIIMLNLYMHTYGKRTVSEACGAFDIMTPERNLGNNLYQRDVEYKNRFLARQEAALERWRNVRKKIDRELEDRLKDEINNAVHSKIFCKPDCDTKYNAIWERIESYKRDGGEIPSSQRYIWDDVGRERIMITSRYSPEFDRTLRLLMTTYGKTTIVEVVEEIQRVRQKDNPYLIWP